MKEGTRGGDEGLFTRVRMWLIYTSDGRGHGGDVRTRDKALPR